MNQTELLFSAIGQVGDDLIARAESSGVASHAHRSARAWTRVLALAACFVLVIGIGVFCRSRRLQVFQNRE